MSFYDHFSTKELEVLKARARHLARAATDSDNEEVTTALIINVHSEAYALPIETLTNVDEIKLIVPVPCTPPFVDGITNIRGHLVPVLSLSEMLGVPGKAQQEGQQFIVVASAQDTTIAFSIETVREVRTFPVREIKPIPSTLKVARPEYVQGYLPDGVVLLNMDYILQDPQLVVDEMIG